MMAAMELAAVHRDLLDRLPDALPRELALAGIVADLAILAERVAVRRRAEGWDVTAAHAFCRTVDRLVRGLHALGVDRVAGTAAENLAARAVVVSDSLLDDMTTSDQELALLSLPAAGSA